LCLLFLPNLRFSALFACQGYSPLLAITPRW
jgi:hypothetical protein